MLCTLAGVSLMMYIKVKARVMDTVNSPACMGSHGLPNKLTRAL
jgi:hypothetical protein